MKALETWAMELGYQFGVLETGEILIEAINLYTKMGYEITPNFPPFEEVTTSVCMKKKLRMIEYIRTNQDSIAFQKLIVRLDKELRNDVGNKDQDFYDSFNSIEKMNGVVVVFIDKKAVGCGAIRAYSDSLIEVKRMYVHTDFRRRGIAQNILLELEKWAVELGFESSILETAKVLKKAVSLYLDSGYYITPNYAPYEAVKTSYCMKKDLI